MYVIDTARYRKTFKIQKASVNALVKYGSSPFLTSSNIQKPKNTIRKSVVIAHIVNMTFFRTL